MMKIDTFDNNDKNRDCTRGQEMLAYLYDELPASERSHFEIHIAECGTCVDEFAELANARFEVFDWRRRAFDPLQTPEFLVPYGERQLKGLGVSGWISSLRELFAVRPGFAAAGAFASLAVVLGLGYFALISNSDSSLRVELSKDEPATTQPSAPVDPPQIALNEAIETPAFEDPLADPGVAAKSPKKVRPMGNERPRSIPAPRRDVNSEVRITQTALRLNDFEDTSDEGLRLVDLFEDIDTSD